MKKLQITILALALAMTGMPVGAQVSPNAPGPTEDDALSVGPEPTFQCRLFNMGCGPKPERLAQSPAPDEETMPAQAPVKKKSHKKKHRPTAAASSAPAATAPK